MVNLGKIKIHSSFFFFIVLIIALGQIKQLFLLVAAATVHELSHVAAARLYGLKTEAIIITPLGETAYINGFDGISCYKKYIILLAGPLANIISAILIFSLNRTGTALSLRDFMYASLAIGAFNMLPVYPFDGGKLTFVFLGNRLGILRSVKYVRFLTKSGIGALFILGCVQITLFPLNFSLLAISVFLLSIFGREKNSMIFSYYKCMLYKGARLEAGLKAKIAVMDARASVSEAEKLFAWDYFHIIHVTQNGQITGTLTEAQIFEASVKSRAQIKLFDIVQRAVI